MLKFSNNLLTTFAQNIQFPARFWTASILAMPKHLNTSGIDGFQSAIEQQKDNKNDVFVLFCGGIDETTGKSWCSDCVKAEPVIDAASATLSDDAVFIHVSVGDKTFWKNQENAFRTHPKLKLSGVPTLIKWGTPKRLVEEECQKADLVTMLFEED